jgi:DNA invertase Pin-like site-specific DNA recombinase
VLNARGREALFRLKMQGVKRFILMSVYRRILPRKGLSNALSVLQVGNELVIHQIDRLGRNTLELLKLEQKLTARQIRLNSLMQPVDLSTASGKLSFITLPPWSSMKAISMANVPKAV